MWTPTSRSLWKTPLPLRLTGKPQAILVHGQSVSPIIHWSLNWESSQLCRQGQENKAEERKREDQRVKLTFMGLHQV